jgi:flagellar biosynthetic protein FliQ
MQDQTVIEIGLAAIILAAKLSAPLLLTALAVGFAISLFQSVTQIQEQTLTFIPKIVAMGLVLVVAGPWMLNEVITYTQQLYSSIPELIAGG